jgi:hypothetical protein
LEENVWVAEETERSSFLGRSVFDLPLTLGLNESLLLALLFGTHGGFLSLTLTLGLHFGHLLLAFLFGTHGGFLGLALALLFCV